jgi:CBS-domain-containing membrane protein
MKQWKVADVMTTQVISVRADTLYGEIISALATHKISAVPVADTFGRVSGVVSEADLLHKVEFLGDDDPPRLFEWGSRKANRAKANAATAAELMTSPAVTVQPGSSVVTAAKLMEQEQVKRLPVIDELGNLVGIVSRNDLLKMYMRPDAEIHDDIVEGVIRRILWLDPLSVEVDVTGGVVTLIGTVDRKTTAEIAAHVTKGVPGVVRVVDKLAWNYDDTVVSASTGL